MLELDCGDSGCRYAKDKSGMRTQGGKCSCHDRIVIQIMESNLDEYSNCVELIDEFAKLVRQKEKYKWVSNK